MYTGSVPSTKMKKDTQVNTYTDSPCKAFVQHRFKLSHCAQCFKPKSHHPQFFEPIARERISENVRLIEVQSNGDKRMPTKLASHRKYESRTNKSNGIHNSDKIFEDGVLNKKILAGKTSQLRKQFEIQDVRTTPPVNRHTKASNGVIQSSTPLKDQPNIMDIPQQETNIPLINDLNSNSNHNGSINEHYHSDSDNEILSDTAPSNRFWRSKWSPKPTRAMDPIPTVPSDVGITDMMETGLDSSVPVLKSVESNAVLQGVATPNDSQRTGKSLASQDPSMPNEFQRMVKSLRHIDPPPDSPEVERKAIKRYNPGRSTAPSKPSAGQVDLKERKTASSLKSTLPSNLAVLPKDNGTVVGSNNLSTNHDRQTSKLSNVSDRIVTRQVNGEDAIQRPSVHKQQSSTNSKTSSVTSGLPMTNQSDLPVSTPPKPKPRHRAAYAQVQIPPLDLGGKNVKIISRDGSVTYYDGSSKPSLRSPTKSGVTNSNGVFTPKVAPRSPTKSLATNSNEESPSEITLRSPTKSVTTSSNGEMSPTHHAAKAYFVVDISTNPPQGLSTADRRSICGPPLPCTPAPRSRPASQRSSRSFDSWDSGDEGKFRHKGSRRSLALSDDTPDDTPRRSLVLSDDNGIILNRCDSIDSALTASTGSDISPVKHNACSTPDSKMLTNDNKGNTPPFPMLLNDKDSSAVPTPSVRSRRDSRDRRRSSGASHYKVPIFIQPQNYDNLGTAKSDSETKLNELTGKMTPEKQNAPEPPMRLTSEDYLMPMKTDSIQSSMNSAELDIVTSPKSPESRDSGSFSATSDSEHKSPNMPSQPFVKTQKQENSQEKFRSRTQSHPCEPVYAKISHDGRKTSVPLKQKRAAPAPPDDQQHCYPDTLPRSDPPPPPVPSKGKSVSCDSLVVDIPHLTPSKQENNVYSQAPKRKQSYDASNSRMRPKPIIDPGKGVIDIKSQAPIAIPRKIHSEIPGKTSTESPKTISSESHSKIHTDTSPTKTSIKTLDETARSQSPEKTSIKSTSDSSAEVIYQIPEELPKKSPNDSSSEVVSPPRRNFQSVRVQTPQKIPSSQCPAPIWTREGSPMKGKAPVPSQIRNARNAAPSPVKNQPQDITSNKMANLQRSQSPPVRRTNSPLENDGPHYNGSASPVSQRATETQAKIVTSNVASRSAAPSPPLGRVVKTVTNNVSTRSAPSPPVGRVAEAQDKSAPDTSATDPTRSKTISPLPPNSPILRRPPQLPQVPDDTITLGPKMETKSKKSKLPWKWRKRGKDGDGSPEREFNAEPVQKWLDEIQKMQREDLNTNRHSLDRLDVINAYKGQPTADIIAKPKESTIQEIVDYPDGPVPRRNSTVKRQAPRIPSGQGETGDKVVDLPVMQKSYSLSPTSRRKRIESCDDRENLYENVGIQRKDGAPPSKPIRRVRNRTTAFEDMLSQKRKAPKVPAEDKPSDQDVSHPTPTPDPTVPSSDPTAPSSDPTAPSSDPTAPSLDPTAPSLDPTAPSFDPTMPSSTPGPVAPPRTRTKSEAKDTTAAQADKVARYLKSAMKSGESSKKFDQDGKPRRPVRIKAPSDENSNNVKKPTCIFDNLEYLLTSDIKMDTKASLDSFYGKEESTKPPNSSTDAKVQCSFPTGDSNRGNGMNAIFDTMLQMNSRTLMAVGSAWEAPSRVPWWSAETKWLEYIDDASEPCCRSGDAVFYEVTHIDYKDHPVAVMISTKSDLAPQLAKFSSEPISPHTNIFTIYQTTTQTVPTKLIGLQPPGSTISNQSDQSQELLDSAVIVAMDKVPCMSLSDFVMDSKAFHHEEPEKYECDVALLLLQLCNAIHHLELHNILLQTINLEQILLMETNLPGSGLRPVLNHLLSKLNQSEEMDAVPEATADQIEQRSAEFSLGVMTYEMLHLSDSFTQGYTGADIPSIPNKSKYSLCLDHLAKQFLTKNSSSRLTANQGALALQTMLWGPQVEQLPLDTKDPKALEQALQQWLLLEQACVVNKAAESSVQQGSTHCNSTFGLRDLLQCQYLSETTVASLKDGLKFLYFAKN